MKITINIDESELKNYLELNDKRKDLLNTMHERIPLYNGNPKKLEKDVVYKDASYNFVIAGVEQNDIRDKVFKKVFEVWANKSV
jgi:hypothetical protein